MRHTPILEITKNVTTSPSVFDGTKTYFATGDVSEAGPLDGSPVTYRDRPSRANLVARHNDVLFAKMQKTEKVLHVNESADEAIFSTGFFNLRAEPENLNPRYLFWYLRSSQFNREKDKRCTGATQKALTLAGLREIEIPLPDSLEDQSRIATILDKADCVRQKREKLISLADEMLRANFLEVFGDPREAVGSKLTLSDVSDISRGRFSPRPRNDPRYYDGKYPFIQTAEIAASDGYMLKFRQTLNEAGIKVSKSFPEGTVFIAIVGATIGATAVSSREFWCPDSVIGIVPNSAEYPAEFLEYLLRFWRPVFIDQAPETARANINLQTLKPVPIPNCHNGEAIKFGQLYRKIYNLKDKLRQMDDCLLFSLSQRAFRGEL